MMGDNGQIVFDIVQAAVEQIAEGSTAIHATLSLVSKRMITEAQALVLIAGANRKIEAALNFLRSKP